MTLRNDFEPVQSYTEVRYVKFEIVLKITKHVNNMRPLGYIL